VRATDASNSAPGSGGRTTPITTTPNTPQRSYSMN
jgi:hypothetical protein